MLNPEAIVTARTGQAVWTGRNLQLTFQLQRTTVCNSMYVRVYVCLSVCLFVCVSVRVYTPR